MIIQLNNISISYGNFLALDDISLNVEGGSIGLLGPNGAGKTTLLKTLLGFLPLYTGSGEVLSMDIKTRQLDIRRKVGYMPEDDCFIPEMNAVSFAAYAGELCGMRRSDATQRAHEVLDYIGVGEERYRMIQTYSVGMRQQVKLAQALIHDPELLFLDEPTNGMDPSGRKKMLDLIKDISTAKNIHIILSSHLLPDVEYTCQDIIVINRGKVITQGNIEELRGNHRRLFEVKIKGARNIFTAALEGLGYECRPAEDDIFKVALPDGVEADIFFKIAVEHGLQIRHLAETRYSLEDIFAQAVSEDSITTQSTV
ncbi:MAG: ATP-binding cassette domain-containing protein [Candidatus Poribacteria bacterium]